MAEPDCLFVSTLVAPRHVIDWQLLASYANALSHGLVGNKLLFPHAQPTCTRIFNDVGCGEGQDMVKFVPFWDLALDLIPPYHVAVPEPKHPLLFFLSDFTGATMHIFLPRQSAEVYQGFLLSFGRFAGLAIFPTEKIRKNPAAKFGCSKTSICKKTFCQSTALTHIPFLEAPLPNRFLQRGIGRPDCF